MRRKISRSHGNGPNRGLFSRPHADRMLNVAAVRAWGIAFDKPFPPVIVK